MSRPPARRNFRPARTAAGVGAFGPRPLERGDDRRRQRARIPPQENREPEPVRSQPSQAELRDVPQTAAGAARAVGPPRRRARSRTPRTAAISASCSISTTRGCSSSPRSTATSCSTRRTPGSGRSSCKSSCRSRNSGWRVPPGLRCSRSLNTRSRFRPPFEHQGPGCRVCGGRAELLEGGFQGAHSQSRCHRGSAISKSCGPSSSNCGRNARRRRKCGLGRRPSSRRSSTRFRMRR